MTLKAVRALREAAVIAVPVARADGDSYALSIVENLLRPDQTVLKLHFPMSRDVEMRSRHRQAAAERLQAELAAGRIVAFLTEGDPLLHSTFIYVLQYLPAGCPLEIVPGVSSIMAAAAQARLPLVNGDQRLAIVPLASGRPDDLPDLRRILRDFDTVVLLKFNRIWDSLLDVLDELGLTGQAVLVERASHASGRIVRDVRALRGSPVHYLSVLIVRAGGAREA